ncbi:hypothetical protein K2173_007155 [Erythroxylum novogranatense]|uniref:F-box domain-containing protein n=1 Tax=Erythroxylum novogranatense TaxID=1862640 RepID=A0AAV8SYI2_9ROSI|nr:hypothetical protein K2173_007155 [Erythroxylum novogranatense]
MSDYLPEEIVEQILVRLPPRAVVRCRATCKRLYYLINSPGFISKTLSYTLSTRKYSSSPGFLLSQYSVRGDLSYNYSLYFDPYTVDDYTHDIPSPFRNDKSSHYLLLDSVHGLVCVVQLGCYGYYTDHIYIWNPLIKRYIKTQKCSMKGSIRDMLVFGFGFDSIRNDYKVMVIARSVWKFKVQVYSLKQGIWSDMDGQWLDSNVVSFTDNPTQRFLNGVIHWLGTGQNDEKLIIGFDVFHDSFKAMKFPGDLYYSKLFQIGETLACVDHRFCLNGGSQKWTSSFDIWVMKDYGVDSSWTKMYCFEFQGIPLVLGIKEDGDLLMVNSYVANKRELLWYSPVNRVMKRTGVQAIFCSKHVWTYMESLTLMDKESGAISYKRHLWE